MSDLPVTPPNTEPDSTDFQHQTVLSEPTTPPVESAPSPESVQPSTVPEEPKKNNHFLVLIIVIIIIAIAVAAGVIGLQHHNKTKTTVGVKKDIPLLVYGTYNNPLNVFYPDATITNGPSEMNEQIFEGLVKFSHGSQIVPDLAVSWTNPNTTTWVFKLHPGVYFHDGDMLTAQDVVYSWQQVAKQTGTSLASIATSTIKSVTAINSSTVQITTTSPDPILLNRLSNMWIIDSKAPPSTKPWELATGAYTVKPGTTPTANNIDLVAFNKWHGGHAYTRALDYVFYADPAKQLSDFISGKIDIDDSASSSNVTRIQKTPGLAFRTTPSTYVDVLGFDTTNPAYPTANPEIREAIDLTINPQAVLKAYGVSGVTVNQVVPSLIPGYDPAVVRPAMNLAMAKQLITQAGYPNGVTITLGVGQPAEAAGQEMATELKAVGITLKLDVATDEGTYFSNISSGVYQAFYEGSSSPILDGSSVLSYWQDETYYNNPTFNAELDTADQTFNKAQRIAELQKASDLLLADNAYIPLYAYNDTYGTKSNIVYPLDIYDGSLNTFFSGVYQK
jgi:peptide/nickel transport system substrate-binding protein